ncbi:hypothetical protein EC957_003930 [Mortierella hygrophila]|uniref:Uncharacterized protein n=1 Tax=Mortierella hygrophila TaxID=979708 RepID=A0A9P6F188_9FUNG|nr:hypothetical protein EC957_003930 [Mortierella hygrophila]
MFQALYKERIMVSKIFLPDGVKAISANFTALADGTRYESTFKVNNRQFKAVVQQVDAATPLNIGSARFVVESIAYKSSGTTAEYIDSNVDVFYGDVTVNVSVFPISPVAKN